MKTAVTALAHAMIAIETPILQLTTGNDEIIAKRNLFESEDGLPMTAEREHRLVMVVQMMERIVATFCRAKRPSTASSLPLALDDKIPRRHSVACAEAAGRQCVLDLVQIVENPRLATAVTLPKSVEKAADGPNRPLSSRHHHQPPSLRVLSQEKHTKASIKSAKARTVKSTKRALNERAPWLHSRGSAWTPRKTASL